MSDVYCTFTGTPANDADLPIDHPLEDEELSDLPVGWTRITIQTRESNPEWETILSVEEAMVAQVMESVPKNQRKAATAGVRVQVAAQLAALKAATAPYVIQTEMFHSSPGEANLGLARLRSILAGDGAETEEGEAAEPAGDEEPSA